MAPIRIAVVIASCGRPKELGQVLDQLATQTKRPIKIVLSVTEKSDLPTSLDAYSDTETVFGTKGLPAQRNRGLERVLGQADLIIFIDDDYIPSRNMLRGAADFFKAHTDVVGANGLLLADGINTPGIPYEEALIALAQHDAGPPPSDRIVSELDGLYGCNMAFRASAIGDARFDEALPLYGWQEDIDFAAQLLPRGRLVRTDGFVGIHRGVKGGRTSGVKFGYSQIVNPIYLSRKGTMRRDYAWRIIRNNLLANHAKLLRPEPWVDRWGRARGNWHGIFDVVMRRDHPTRINQL